MSKISVAGKITKENNAALEKFMKKKKIETRSQTLDIILTEYFSANNREVTLRLPKGKAAGDSSIQLKESLEALKRTISEMEKQLKEVSKK